MAALILHVIIRRAINRFARRRADADSRHPHEVGTRAQTIVLALRTVATAFLWALAALVGLNQAGIDVGPLLAAAGVVGVAIGLGAQHFTKDLIGGVCIVLEDQYRVGDYVEVNGAAGRVEKVTLRSTTLRDVHGKAYVIANGDIRTSANLTKGFSRYVIDLPVPYEEDADRVIDVARRELEEMRRSPELADIISGPLQVLGIDSYAPPGVIAKVYVETAPGRQWDVGRMLRGRIKQACDEEGISLRVA
jgi:small conductance mechanosensitive channel